MPRKGLPAVNGDTSAAPPTRLPSPRVRQAIALLLSGEVKTQKAAAVRVGVRAEVLSRSLATMHGQAFLARETRRAINHAQAPAAATLVKLLNAKAERVQAEVAAKLLAIAGIKSDDTTRVAVGVDVRVGYVVNLSDKPSEISE